MRDLPTGWCNCGFPMRLTPQSHQKEWIARAVSQAGVRLTNDNLTLAS